MNKASFLKALGQKLSRFPRGDVEERIAFYEEMIDDRIEEGMTEQEAIAAVGSVDDVAEQIMAELPLSKIVASRVKSTGKLRAWEIALLVLGSPVWVPLVAAGFAVLLSVYAVVWSAVACIYALNLSFAAGTVYSIPCAVQYVHLGKPAGAFFMLGAGIACAGLFIFMGFASVRATKGVVNVTKRFVRWMKSCFVKREESDYAYA
ncbi:MAG: DUF1700 domain-containing protein [Clostridia bacterium]|nr:DUF1700 domain-containing protein [Clostridia bacterium]